MGNIFKCLNCQENRFILLGRTAKVGGGVVDISKCLTKHQLLKSISACRVEGRDEWEGGEGREGGREREGGRKRDRERERENFIEINRKHFDTCTNNNYNEGLCGLIEGDLR